MDCAVCHQPSNNEVLHRGPGIEEHAFHTTCHDNLSEKNSACGLCDLKIQQNLTHAILSGFYWGIGLFASGALAHKIITGNYKTQRLENVLLIGGIAATIFGCADNKLDRNFFTSLCGGALFSMGISTLAQYLERPSLN